MKDDLWLIEQRATITDEDPFAVFNQENVDSGRIFRGKKYVLLPLLSSSPMECCRTRDDPADLDDKAHLEGMEERYARLGLVRDISDGEYDDEYDDTYDDGTVNVQDKDDQIDADLQKNENR